MILLIDPPVGPFSPESDIRAWLEELAAMRREYAGDAEALAAIDRAEQHARLWLELRADDPSAQ